MSKDLAIENAEDVIEAFGGIRPMAKKLDVAVTTVQGWKKRNVIPATRYDEIVQAAEEHGVDLSDVLENAQIANQNDPINHSVGDDNEEDVFDLTTSISSNPDHEIADLKQKVEMMEQQAQSRTMMGAMAIAVILVLALLGLAFMFMSGPTADEAEAERLRLLEQELSAVQSEVEGVKEEQSFLGGLIPEDLGAQIQDLKTQAEEAQANIGAAVEQAQVKAQDISNDVLAEGAGNLEQRLTRLETHVRDLTGSPVIAGMLEKVQTLQQDLGGQQLLDESLIEVNGVLNGLDGSFENLNGALGQAREQSDVLGQTFDGVPQDDLKAAALLLGMTQFRSSLNRDNEAFQSDLEVLRKLVGSDDPELNAALDRLAPHAESGVLTPGGLSTEFRTLAGEAVVASLKGEDVSIQDRAQARLNSLFQIEKDGELITGTDTQATLARTERMLQDGDIAGAIENAQALDGEAAATIAPWLDQAQATLLAERAKDVLTRTINMSAYGASGITAGGVGSLGGGQLIQNEETGINVYVPNKAFNPANNPL